MVPEYPERTIPWPCDPHDGLLWLTSPMRGDLVATPGQFATTVSRAHPDMFEVIEYQAFSTSARGILCAPAARDRGATP
jgi:hypothetical protein